MHRTNIHKHPWISRLMCWLGRHDYELDKVLNPTCATLKCFYCDQERVSSCYWVNNNKADHIDHILINCAVCGEQYWEWTLSSHSTCPTCLRNMIYQTSREYEKKIFRLKSSLQFAKRKQCNYAGLCGSFRNVMGQCVKCGK